MSEDIASEFLDVDGDKDMDMYVATGGYEKEIIKMEHRQLLLQ